MQTFELSVSISLVENLCSIICDHHLYKSVKCLKYKEKLENTFVIQ